MFKRILTAIDGSATSLRALKLALALARTHDATLHVLHVVDEAMIAQGFHDMACIPPDHVDSLLAGMRDAGGRILARADRVAREYGARIQPILVESLGHGVADTILTQARKLRAELIVMGTHGRRGLTRLVMGSDAETVVREARVPVLLVRVPAASRTVRGAAKHIPERRAAARTRKKKAAA